MEKSSMSICNGCGLVLVDRVQNPYAAPHNLADYPQARPAELEEIEMGGEYVLHQVCPECKSDDNLEPLDLFSAYHLLPDHVQAIVDTFDEDGEAFKECRRLARELAAHGYDFEYYLDGVPFNLRKV